VTGRGPAASFVTRDDGGGLFAALGAVDGDGVGVGEFIEFGEVVVHRLVFVGEHGEGLLLQGQAGDDPDGIQTMISVLAVSLS
jgi:hypothetical protein